MSLAAKQHAAYDPLLSAAQAAEYLGLNPETLLLKARRREIACVRMSAKKGSPAKFRLSVLNAWVRAHEMRAARSPG